MTALGSPSSLFGTPSSPSTPLKQYFSRRHSSQIRTNDLPLEHEAKGLYTPAGLFYASIKLTVPLAYIYILLILLRELCVSFPETIYDPIQTYTPLVAVVVSTMKKSSLFVEVWAVIEAIFYICLKLHIRWLQYLDPLELSLSSAPMLELQERRDLWDKIVECESDDPVNFLTGWFFDQQLENISKYDVLDFTAWSMFEGRNQEHLTSGETRQLHDFVEELEWRISVHMYGIETDDVDDEDHHPKVSTSESEEFPSNNREGDVNDWRKTAEGSGGDADKRSPGISTSHSSDVRLNSGGSSGSLDDLQDKFGVCQDKELRPRPRKVFRFPESTHDEASGFFSNLYEDFRKRYEHYRLRLENTDFHPVQDIRNFVAEKRQQLYEAEEQAMATASHMYENAYSTFVSPGSAVDKQLTALGHATQSQLTEAWNSMLEMKDRLETAKFISVRRKRLQQQLKGYRLLLDNMRSSSAVPTKQMADLMRKITQCYDAMEKIESSARDAFVKATGYARKNILTGSEPQRYAKYSSDPLLGVSTYPLMFHLLILGVTDGGLRIMMKRRGFQRLNMGPISYYFHPGRSEGNLVGDNDNFVDQEEMTPIVFCHGIGIGLIVYVPLIDELLKLGRPIFLPEIPYVSGFRPWQSPYSVLPPAAVTSTLTAMMATHGFLHGTFVGHSYGTSWLSYMCKDTPSVVSAVLFIDPICFCLHHPRLTKQFVYHRADPGSTSYMVRTDVTVNWTIQRSFPWARISLYMEQIPAPCAVFLSDRDALVPAERVEKYLRSKGAPVKDKSDADTEHFAQGPINVTVFRGEGHGDWIETSSSPRVIADAVDVLCRKSEDLGIQR